MTATSHKLALLFPGQGAQQPGMGAWLLDRPTSQRIFSLASQAAGLDLAAVCRQGPEAQLGQTETAQPALLAVGLSCWQALAARGVQPAAAAGHSLGEFGAWVVSGLLGLEEACRLVAERGRLMAAAAGERPGGMAAVLGLTGEQVAQICRQAAASGVVVPANYNCPGQVVISGEPAGLEAAARLVQATGGKVVRLAVGGAFHSPLMEQASTRFAKVVESVHLGQVSVPVAANLAGIMVSDRIAAREALAGQMLAPVRWEAGMRSLLAAGVDVFLEMAPGRTLAGLLRRIDREAQVLSVDDEGAFEQAVQIGRGG